MLLEFRIDIDKVYIPLMIIFLILQCIYQLYFHNFFASSDVLEGTYMGRKVAIKQLKDNEKAAQMFLAEASVMT